ncbi:uncharacterized protein LOC132260521 [Phlebotomus argentipes]|uniref:uncharacterized protein LOC132260521 n=1 Tax=Phlebotomus argentipes TaxID=94469 RepID=UPI002892E3F4|nr:uncharacterized protein LOC132260521 [Phlebotomus argentipes]XP_059614681.1 uncharacterized protein LOC132260521 [Phlebotomus argentipes]XP_059614682.1 uncharacterized protein LOC132260521 [Phlebotomus argentipes]
MDESKKDILLKRKIEEYHDPDYKCHAEKRQKCSTEDRRLKIQEIIKKEFQLELVEREKEAFQIEDRLAKAKKQLHELKYAAVSSFYKSGEIHKLVKEDGATLEEKFISKEQISLHPAIKKLVGKTPKRYSDLVLDVPRRKAAKDAASLLKQNLKTKKDEKLNKNPPENCTGDEEKVDGVEEEPKITPLNSSRGRNQEKHLIIVGNTSKFIAENQMNSSVSHKWLVYVHTRDHHPIEKLVQRIRFFLHPTYQPNDCVEIEKPPFKISRFGWGEFIIRVQLHFWPALKQKPVQIFHRVKLDDKCTGLETFGAETIAELWLNRISPDSEEQKSTEGLPYDFTGKLIKKELLSTIDKVDSRNKERDSKPKSIWKLDYTSHIFDHSYSKNHHQNAHERMRRIFNSIVFTSVRAAVEFLLRRLPLFSSFANESSTISLTFPFIRASEEDYNALHWTKRFSNEWYRAKFICRLLRQHASLKNLSVWSTKDIVIFARKYFYTPPNPEPRMQAGINLKDFLKAEIRREKLPAATSTTPSKVRNWIAEQHLVPQQSPEIREDDFIDVENNSVAKRECRKFCDASQNAVLWTLDDVFQEKSTKDEKDVQDVMKIVLRTFIEDLVRESAANANDTDNIVIQTPHVKSTIMSKREFDFLTNQGLGRSSLKDENQAPK